MLFIELPLIFSSHSFFAILSLLDRYILRCLRSLRCIFITNSLTCFIPFCLPACGDICGAIIVNWTHGQCNKEPKDEEDKIKPTRFSSYVSWSKGLLTIPDPTISIVGLLLFVLYRVLFSVLRTMNVTKFHIAVHHTLVAYSLFTKFHCSLHTPFNNNDNNHWSTGILTTAAKVRKNCTMPNTQNISHL